MSDRLWAAVDRITQPTSKRVERDPNPAAMHEARELLRRQYKAGRVVRHDVRRLDMMKTSHATVGSLWDQAVDALATGSSEKMDEGKAKQVHRTPCDVQLMEYMQDIDKAVRENLTGAGLRPREDRTDGFVRLDDPPAAMRQLASYVVTHAPEHVEWWIWRFDHWGRLLATALNQVQQQRSRRIRSVGCPECGVQWDEIEDPHDAGKKIPVRPLLVDFYEGHIRAAECTVCGKAWFRGDELWELRDKLDAQAEA